MEANRQLKSTWIAQQLLEIFKSKPHWPAKDIVETIRISFRVLVKKSFAYKVKYYAHRLLHGSMKQHYSNLGFYLEALKASCPNSYFKLEVDEKTTPPTFKSVFFCFDGVRQGWLNGCRKVLCIDGCFLKTFLGGALLSAVGRYGNEQMYPLAWAVVEGETLASWTWFLQELKKALGEQSGEGWTIISDEHQAILSSVANELPNAEHRHCARHIFSSWHRIFGGDEMKMFFWKAAKAYNEAEYNAAIADMEKVDPGAVIAFKAHNPKLFCRAWVKTDVKCDVILSNMAETWNGYIINARSKHLYFMLEDIRGALMQRMYQKRVEMEKAGGKVCPRVQERLEKEKVEAAWCYALPSSINEFQVNHKMDSLVVDLEKRSCTCRRWDTTGIPCCHAIACIFLLHQNAEDWVHESYKTETYMKTYSVGIKPCPGEKHWPQVIMPLDPPPIRVGPGRPRKNRIKHPMEDPKKKGKLTKHGIQMSCSVCNSKSHNKRKCPDKDKSVNTEPAPKRGRGRPRKEQAESSSIRTSAPSHHNLSAQPSRTGRGGRVIVSGRGSRGGGRGRVTVSRRGSRGGGRGRGRGRGGNILRGTGVLYSEDGSIRSVQ